MLECGLPSPPPGGSTNVPGDSEVQVVIVAFGAASIGEAALNLLFLDFNFWVPSGVGDHQLNFFDICHETKIGRGGAPGRLVFGFVALCILVGFGFGGGSLPFLDVWRRVTGSGFPKFAGEVAVNRTRPLL